MYQSEICKSCLTKIQNRQSPLDWGWAFNDSEEAFNDSEELIPFWFSAQSAASIHEMIHHCKCKSIDFSSLPSSFNALGKFVITLYCKNSDAQNVDECHYSMFVVVILSRNSHQHLQLLQSIQEEQCTNLKYAKAVLQKFKIDNLLWIGVGLLMTLKKLLMTLKN